MTASHRSAGPILVLHWGTRGAGPLIASQLVSAFRSAGRAVVASFARDAEAATSARSDAAAVLTVPTARTALGLVLGVPGAIRNAIRLRSFIRAQGVTTVVTAMHSVASSPWLRVSIPRGVRYVPVIHDYRPNTANGTTLLSIVERICVAQELSRADAVITLSDSVAGQVRRGEDERLTVLSTVHGPLREPVREPRSWRSGVALRVGMVGRIDAYKGVDVFAAAIEILLGRGVTVQASVHGSGDASVLESARAESASIEWDVRWIPDAELDAIVGQLDVIVLPYRQASQSGVIALAMSSAVPVVVTPLDGLVQQIEGSGAGIVAEGFLASDLADAIERLVRDEALYTRLSRSAVEAARGAMSWDRAAADILSMLDEGSRP